MSEKLCTLRTQGGGGGKYTETSLWTNQSPTSTFAAQTVTLSDSISKYKYIAIKYCTNNSTTNQISKAIYLVSDFITASKDSSANHNVVGLTIQGADNAYYSRNAHYVNDTSVAFTLSMKENSSGTNTQGSIPLEILGLNELDHAKGFDESVLWTNSAPTSTFAGQDVTLSDDINSYDYLKFTYRVTTSEANSLNYIISVSDFKKSVQNASIHNCVLGLSTDDSAAHTRRVYYKTDTTVNFNNAYQLNAAASNNATVIPTSIVGCKFR